MSDFLLLHTVYDRYIDTVLSGLVGIYELMFPDRVRSYFVLGSHTDNTAVSLSDVDLFIVFKDDFRNDAEKALAQNAAFQCRRLSPVRLDIVIRSEAALSTEHSVFRTALKTSSLLIYGADIRESIPLPDSDAFTRDVTDGAILFVTNVMRKMEHVALPLNYPDPHGEFYGYDHKRIDTWYPPNMHAGTKELVSVVGRVSTALIALKTGQLTGSKRESMKRYRELIGDHWSDVIENVYEFCKLRLRYMIPENFEERQTLRHLCEQVLVLENEFMTLYGDYLRGLRDSGDEKKKSFAESRLTRLGWV